MTVDVYVVLGDIPYGHTWVDSVWASLGDAIKRARTEAGPGYTWQPEPEGGCGKFVHNDDPFEYGETVWVVERQELRGRPAR